MEEAEGSIPQFQRILPFLSHVVHIIIHNQGSLYSLPLRLDSLPSKSRDQGFGHVYVINFQIRRMQTTWSPFRNSNGESFFLSANYLPPTLIIYIVRMVL